MGWLTEKNVEWEERQLQWLDGSLVVASEVQGSMACFRTSQRQSTDCYFLQSFVEVGLLPLQWVLSVPIGKRGNKM